MFRSPSDATAVVLKGLLPGFVAGLCASLSFAADLYPFTEGVQWVYQEIYPTDVETLMTYFDGTTDFNGVTAHVQRCAHSPWLALADEYWTRDAEGRVYKLGWTSGQQTCTFDPPVLFIDADLSVGKKWNISTITSLFGLFTAECEVTAIGQITVPAGTFTCTTIEWTFPTPASAGKVGQGALSPPGITSSSDYDRYADGVGLVRADLAVPVGERFNQLVLLGPRVGVTAVTWSAVRRLYD